MRPFDFSLVSFRPELTFSLAAAFTTPSLASRVSFVACSMLAAAGRPASWKSPGTSVESFSSVTSAGGAKEGDGCTSALATSRETGSAVCTKVTGSSRIPGGTSGIGGRTTCAGTGAPGAVGVAGSAPYAEKDGKPAGAGAAGVGAGADRGTAGAGTGAGVGVVGAQG